MTALTKSLALLAVVGCAAPAQSTDTHDAGADVSAQPPPITLATAGDIFVARGQAVNASFAVSCCTHVTIDLVDLPPGVSATSAPTDGTGVAGLVLNASSDAPQSDVTALAVAFDETGVRGTAPVRVAVTNAEGSLDPTFGSSGIATTLPVGMTVDALAMTPDGRLWIGGTENGQCGLTRLASDGTLDTTLGQSGWLSLSTSTQWCNCLGLASDSSGNVAVLVFAPYQTLAPALITVDATGTVAPPTMLDDGFGVAWVGSRWLVTAANEIIAINTSGEASRSPIPTSFGSFQAAAFAKDGSALLVGAGIKGAAGLKVMPDPSGAYVVDPSFGVGGLADLGAAASLASAVVLDGTDGFLVGVDGGIEHVFADGAFDPSFGDNGRLPFATTTVEAIVAMPSGDFVAFGDDHFELASIRFSSTGKRDAAFGAFGFSAYLMLNGTTFTRLAYDGTAHLYVADYQRLGRLLVSP